MNNDNNILGCFISLTVPSFGLNNAAEELSSRQGDLVRNYIAGENGFSKKISKLNSDNYGTDLTFILIRYHVNPIPFELQYLKPIEYYRRKEKSIAVVVIINTENFFIKSEEERLNFLNQSLLERLDLVKERVKRKKFDTNMDLLISDVRNLLGL